MKHGGEIVIRLGEVRFRESTELDRRERVARRRRIC
ncbi:hypothetical protein BDBG_17569 [Blastomyces gilchristii SLH14081]|uniref:Uncharacterized protein n=1 Tax=Blastomyces gilchristii (strain SLH14081) TaxID=559298 RepID=A0A179UUL5_BLAGS|nr:uncharacterized protein BDBG_17569 [Blastomyces gilchristii SLH14081]OAT11734.1 hypothetical protein BDBG_17569 [Blastomyces gilchristii SLH14081]